MLQLPRLRMGSQMLVVMQAMLRVAAAALMRTRLEVAWMALAACLMIQMLPGTLGRCLKIMKTQPMELPT